MKNKSIIRREYLSARDLYTEEYINNSSSLIISKLIKMPFIKQLKTVMLYMPYKKEVDCIALISLFLQQKINVLIPKVKLNPNSLIPIKITDPKLQLAPGFKDILEPVTGLPEWVNPIDAVIITGCCFNKDLFRLGYGGGFFDRFFSNYTTSFRIGLFFSKQLCNNIPIEEHDIPLNIIITENKIYGELH